MPTMWLGREPSDKWSMVSLSTAFEEDRGSAGVGVCWSGVGGCVKFSLGGASVGASFIRAFFEGVLLLSPQALLLSFFETEESAAAW